MPIQPQRRGGAEVPSLDWPTRTVRITGKVDLKGISLRASAPLRLDRGFCLPELRRIRMSHNPIWLGPGAGDDQLQRDELAPDRGERLAQAFERDDADQRAAALPG